MGVFWPLIYCPMMAHYGSPQTALDLNWFSYINQIALEFHLQSISQSINQSVSQSINQSTNQSINQFNKCRLWKIHNPVAFITFNVILSSFEPFSENMLNLRCMGNCHFFFFFFFFNLVYSHWTILEVEQSLGSSAACWKVCVGGCKIWSVGSSWCTDPFLLCVLFYHRWPRHISKSPLWWWHINSKNIY